MERELVMTGGPGRLDEALDLDELLTALLRAAGSQVPGGTPFVVLRDPGAGTFTGLYPPGSAGLAHVRGAELDRRLVAGGPLRDLLERGEAVVVTDGGERRALPEAGRGGDAPSLLLVPIVFRSELLAFLCLVTAAGEERPASGSIELLQALCRETAPVFARLWPTEARTLQPSTRSRWAESGPVVDVKVEEGEAENQLRAALLQNIAHELRTPLTAMRGYTRMMLEGRSGELNETQREYLSIVAENIQRLLALTQNLLRLTSIPRLQLEPIDLSELWNECSARARSAALEHGVAIQQRIPPGPLMVQGDRQKVTHVLDSLLGAALCGVDRGGEIRMELSRSVDESVTAHIAATGPVPRDRAAGVLPEAAAAVARDPEAALASVQDIVFLHGGRITMTGRIGESLKFVFTLPAIRGSGA